ncbi:MAG: histidine kinase [Saprospiraceae bacterium]|nr:histidine kinase [Saprospiraceae bacterium]
MIWITAFFILLTVSYLTANENGNFFASLRETFFLFVPIIPITYLAFWTKEYFFDRRKYLLYIFAAISIVAIGVILYEAVEPIRGTVRNSRSQNITNFIFLQLIAVGLQYFKRGIVNQYQIQELKAKTATSELNTLKAQLNPHFLFNTLNNIYGVNQIDSEIGSEMIMELSDVMRYHLEFSKEGKVKLEDEIQLLNSYIKLEKLRLRETCDVQVKFNDANENLKISPLLFLPFLENAFKHGTHPNKECFVHIELKTTKDNLYFMIRNSVVINRKIVKTNIGLQNTKRRLELIYPKKHQLNIAKDDQEHLVEIFIEL